MVKQRKTKDASPSSPVKSDEEAIKERRVRESYKNADLYTTVHSWALWAVAAAWFLLYVSEAPSLTDMHLVCDPSVNMVLAGIFCGHLANIKPQGRWSWWRRPLHLAWGVAWAVMGLSFTRLGGLEQVKYPYHMAVAMLALAVGQFFTCPSAGAVSDKASQASFGRLVLLIDAILGFYLCAALAMNGGADFHPKAAKLGWTGIVLSVCTLGLTSAGFAFCQTDAEMISAVPSALIAHLCGASMSFFAGGAMKLPFSALALLHLALYLPFPGNRVDTNPFYVSIRAKYRSMQNLLKNPIDGWGEDDG